GWRVVGSTSRDPAVANIERRRIRKERGGVAVLAESQEDAVEAWRPRRDTRQLTLEQRCIVARRSIEVRGVGGHSVHMLRRDRHMIEQRGARHVVVAALVVGRGRTLIAEEGAPRGPWNRVEPWQ